MSIEKIKLLLEYGANLDFYNNEAYIELPLSAAIISDKMDVVLYLLQKGANYDLPMYTMLDDGQKVYILEALRKCIVELDSKSYKEKRDVVSFLKNKGLQYSKEPIPKKTLEEIKIRYPNNWEDYIGKY